MSEFPLREDQDREVTDGEIEVHEAFSALTRFMCQLSRDRCARNVRKGVI